MIRLVRTKAKDGKNGKKICQNFLNCKPREVKKFAVLHHFADASQFAFGAVSYPRMMNLTECLLLVPHGEVLSSTHQANDSLDTRTLSSSPGHSMRPQV